MINQQKVEEAVKMLLEALGEDPSREGLIDTPERMARMYQEILGGVEDDASKHLHKTFLAGNNDMVVEKDITFYSTCEHHMMPFFGKAHIAYVPDGKVVGLSKLARCVEAFARRLQIQEKMTQQIAEAMMVHLAPKGVMVVIEAEHLCMTMRGVSKPGSKTLTVITKGCFAEREDLRNTFWSMVR